MTISLLTTKFYIPPVRTGTIPRPRLFERLQGGFERRLTLISAPAGFGKTTLVAQCIAASEWQAAWLSLDSADNDPTRFWTYLIAALQTVQPTLGQTIVPMFKALQPLKIENLLTPLINEIAALDNGRIVLVLDDFHLINTPQIIEGLVFLLDNLPSSPDGLHLIISGRADLPWPIARLRARGELTELRSADLRFTLEEVTVFLNEAVGLKLSSEDVAALDARIEGWVAGLQMAVLSMRHHQDASAFIRAFGGSHRYVLDYLMEEVLVQQSPAIQIFLLQTSILGRLTAPLCDYVTCRTDSQATLVRLEQANLFIIPLDDERRWYRYHHLFADLLQRQLAQTDPEQILSLNCRASEWYQAQQLIPEAIGYALTADDVERVANLVENVALHAMESGELNTLLGWLDKLPDSVLQGRPWLLLARGWASAFLGQLDAAELSLQNTEIALQVFKGDSEQQECIKGRIAAVRTYVEETKGNVAKAIELAYQTLHHLGDRAPRLRAFTAIRLGNALGWTGNLDEAFAAYEIANQSSQIAGDVVLAVTALSEMALLCFMRARRELALDLFHQALDVAKTELDDQRPTLPVGLTYLQMGMLYYELDEVETAMHYSQAGMNLCNRWGDKNALLNAHLSQARMLLAQGHHPEAFQAIEKAKFIAASLSTAAHTYVENWHVTIQLQLGNAEFASVWAEKRGLNVNDAFDPDQQFDHMTFARLLIEQGKFRDAESRFIRLLENAERTGSTFRVVRCLVLMSILFERQQKTELALINLRRALILAEPGGFARVFVDEGELVEQLLHRSLRDDVVSGFVGKLLNAFEKSQRGSASPTQRDDAGANPLVEPLSHREREVLRLLRTHLSAPEIAQTLIISRHTVRTHIKNIYAKLGVHNRAEAVECAQELGVL